MYKRPGNVGAILLAAGDSTRFGSNKLLFELDGKPMVQRVLETVGELPFAGRTVVTQYSRVETLAEKYNISAVQNSHPEWGISYSIRLGLERLPDMDGWMFLVCDQPRLRKAAVNKLLESWQNSPMGIAALENGGVPGNPVIFSSSYKKQLEDLRGDRGGKSILLRCMDDVLLVEAEAEDLEDLDYFP